MDTFYRVLSEHDLELFQPMTIRSSSARKDIQAVRSGSFVMKISKKLERKDYVRFGKGFHFFSKKAVSIVEEAVPTVRIFPVALSYSGESETYYVIEAPGQTVRLEPKETAGYLDLNSFYIDPSSVAGKDIVTFQNSNETIVSAKLRLALVEAQVSGVFFEPLAMTSLGPDGGPFGCYNMTYTNNSKYLWIKPELAEDRSNQNGKWKIKQGANFVRYSGTVFPDLVGSTLAEHFYSEAFVEFLAGISEVGFDTQQIFVSHGGVTKPYYQIVPKLFLQSSDSPPHGMSIQIGDRTVPRYFPLSADRDKFPVGLSGTRYLVLSNKEKNKLDSKGFSNVEFRKFKLVEAGDV